MDTRQTPNRRQQTQYLIAYNLVCAVLWTAVLGRVILLIPLVGFESVIGGVGDFTKWTQTLALLEIVHSLTGRESCVAPIRCPGLFADDRGQVSFTLLSSQPPCKSPPAFFLFGPWSIATLWTPHPPSSTALCSLPGPSQRSYGTATLSSICKGVVCQIL